MTDADLCLERMAGVLSALDQDVDDARRIDRVRLLEELKSAAAAAQAREAAAFAASQRAQQIAQGVRADRAERGIAAQVGLAMRASNHRATRYVGWAKILTTELPTTFAALRRGHVTEWRAMIVARGTASLSREHRAEADAAVGPRLESWGDQRVARETRRVAYRLDPDGYLDRLRRAEEDRRVTVRPGRRPT